MDDLVVYHGDMDTIMSQRSDLNVLAARATYVQCVEHDIDMLMRESGVSQQTAENCVLPTEEDRQQYHDAIQLLKTPPPQIDEIKVDVKYQQVARYWETRKMRSGIFGPVEQDTTTLAIPIGKHTMALDPLIGEEVNLLDVWREDSTTMVVLSRAQYFVFNVASIKTMWKDPRLWFTECMKDQLGFLEENLFEFTQWFFRLSVQSPSYIPVQDLARIMLMYDEEDTFKEETANGILVLIPTDIKIDYSASLNTMATKDIVGAWHCQEGTDFSVTRAYYMNFSDLAVENNNIDNPPEEEWEYEYDEQHEEEE